MLLSSISVRTAVHHHRVNLPQHGMVWSFEGGLFDDDAAIQGSLELVSQGLVVA